MTEAILKDAYRSGATELTPPEMPPYLIPNAAPVWTDEYPQEFRDRLPELAGYEFHTSNGQPGSISGYFVTAERKRYDFQTPGGSAHGLLLTTLDPLGRETAIQYDTFDLLPVEVTDPAGMTMSAVYDYRVLQPREVTDPNLNRSAFAFSPLGFVTKAAVMGKADKAEGDTLETPGTVFEYDFFAFQKYSDPVFVRSIKRIHHVNDTDVPLPERDETIIGYEYSDGFGRLLQTRTQAEDVIFGDLVFGNGVVPATQGDPATKKVVVGQQNVDVNNPNVVVNNPNVVVSGWQTYDNKGRVIEKYEPFFAKGWDYQSRAEVEAQSSEQLFVNKVTMHYDPRGQAIRTVNPDGSEQRVIYGIPESLSTPDQFIPTPWEAYTYDANDNAGRTHPASPTGFQHCWDTPSNILIDALGRTIEAVVRNRERIKLENGEWGWSEIKEYGTASTYDIRGNLLIVTDALNREAFQHVYDLTNQPLRIESIDAGLRRKVFDALGNPVEGRDSKGALALHAYDEELGRPIRLWARDGVGQVMTLRERLIYGDSSDSGLTKEQAQEANQLGKLIQHYDEAGLATADLFDFKGNLLEKTRRVIADAQILSVFQGAAANNWQIQAYRVDWQPAAGSSLEAHANQLLDPAVYQTSTSYDGLNRIRKLTYPRDVEGNRKELHPHYNRAGALEKVLLDETVYVERIAYNAKGQRSLIAYGNGVLTRYAYDEHTFRLKRLHTDHWQKSGEFGYQPFGDALQDLAYEYDLVGNIQTIRDRTPGCGIPNTEAGLDALDRAFSYDAIYRLLSATGREHDIPSPAFPGEDVIKTQDPTKTCAYTENYQYDKAGNIELFNHQANFGTFNRLFSLVAGNNQLAKMTIGQGAFSYLYDANGNMVAENTTRHFEWDYADRMRVFRTQPGNAEPSVHAHYLYDAGGQRIKKFVRNQGGQVEVTVYVEGIFEYQAKSGVQNNSLHVLDNQSRVAFVRVGQPFTNDVTPAVKFHLGDHLGSGNLVIDNNGTLINREEYTPYGETSFGSFAKKRFRFTGKERDEESGLNYHEARYYLPWAAKWVSCDPLGSEDAVNLYQYVNNRPIRLSDKSGLEGEPPQDESNNLAVCGCGAVVQKEKVIPLEPNEIHVHGTKRPTQNSTDASSTSTEKLEAFVEGSLGVSQGVTQSLIPGGFLASSARPNSRRFEYFRGAGQVATGIAQVFLGLSAIAGGGSAVGGGIAASPFTFGASLGVSALGGGAVAVGVASVGVGISNVTAGIFTLNRAASLPPDYPRDYPSKKRNLKSPERSAGNAKDNNYSGTYNSERDARQLAREKVRKDPIEVEPGKWRSRDGKWQYRAKPTDLEQGHIHLEELDPKTGEVLQNQHLRWPTPSK